MDSIFEQQSIFKFGYGHGFLDIMLLHTYQTTIQCKHNFNVHWETKKIGASFIAICILLHWSGRESTTFPRLCLQHPSSIPSLIYLQGSSEIKHLEQCLADSKHLQTAALPPTCPAPIVSLWSRLWSTVISSLSETNKVNHDSKRHVYFYGVLLMVELLTVFPRTMK